MSTRGYRGYISTNQHGERSVPQNVQQLVIRDYCRKNGLEFLLSATEYGNSYTMLDSLIRDRTIAGIVMYSIWQLPDDFAIKLRIALRNRKRIHFAAENIRILSRKDIENLEDIWLLRKLVS